MYSCVLFRGKVLFGVLKALRVKRETRMQEIKPEIACSLFLRQEGKIKILTDDINRPKDTDHKARFAGKMANEVEILLSCRDYDKHSQDCVNCHTVSILRSKMAKLILKINRIFGE